MNLTRSPLAVIAVVVALTGALAPSPKVATDDRWTMPVGPPGEVVRGFEPPTQRWAAGHRGVDLAAPGGAEVRAAAAGTVTYAGMLAGRGVVVVRHGRVRTTYEPVIAAVAVGDDVVAAQPLGTLAATPGHCAPASCLHWGALDGERYLDPMSFVGAGVKLLALGERSLSGDPPPPPNQPPGVGLGWPVAQPVVTSPFGMRTHPVTGQYKLHDGTDFRAPCGTPIRASAAGTVTGAATRGAYGLRVDLDHGVLGGVHLATSYSHLSRLGVGPRQAVGVGDVVGWSGTTGSSTGCHLHFMVYAAGSLADPMDWLPRRRDLGADKVAARTSKPATTSYLARHGVPAYRG